MDSPCPSGLDLVSPVSSHHRTRGDGMAPLN